MGRNDAVVGPATVATRPEPLYPKLVARRNAPAKAVAAHQRARLHAAMIEACARHGYAQTTARELVALAGVSTKSLYRHFGSKEECFFATYDLVVHQAMGRISTAYRGAGDDPGQDRADGLCRAFEAFTAELMDRPTASRLALAEILAAPLQSAGRIERSEAQFAAMIAGSLRRDGKGTAIPPAVLRALIGGVWFVARTRLLEGHPEAIGAAGAQFSEWLQVYRVTAGARLPAGCGVTRRPAAGERANLADSAFLSQFDDGREGFLSTLEWLSARALAEGLRAGDRAPTWAAGVCRVVEALFARLAVEEVFARAAFLDVFAAGPAGAARHAAILRGFARSLVRRAPPAQRPSELVAEAIVGAVWSIGRRHAALGRLELLPNAAPLATFVILAPILGADAALATIVEEARGGTFR